MHAGVGPRAAAVRSGVAAGLVPVAAVAALDPGGWYPFGPAKQGAVFVAALATIAFAVGRPGRLPRLAAGLWIALLTWLGLAAVFGVERWYAWIGTPERRLGWLTWALFAGCAWAGAKLAAAPGALRSFARGVAAAAAWCGAYVLVEWWWRRPVEWSGDTSRLGGPFGSAAYLGAAVCLLVPIAAALAFDAAERRAWRVVAAFGAAAGLVGLVGAGTRAAWVALAAVGVIVLVRRRPSARSMAAVATALFVAVLVVAPRLGDVTDRSGGGGASRAAEWRVAARVIAERPVLGAGPEGYRIVFADGVDGEYEARYGREVQPDRAHSGPLDVAAIGGIPAALLYTALVALVVVRAVGALRRGAVLTVGIAAAALAYTVQQVALFPLAELDPTFWLLAGTLLSDSAAGKVRSVTRNSCRRVGWGRRFALSGRKSSVGHAQFLPQSWRAGGVGLVAVGVFAVSVVGVAADRAARRALERTPGSDGAVAAARRAAALRPDVVRYHLLVSAVEADRGSVTGARASVDAAATAARISPGDPIVRRRLAEARTQLAAVTGDPADVVAARTDWERLVADDPHCGECRRGLDTVRLLAGES